MADPYQAVIDALRKHSISAQFHGPSQLVVSCQTGPVWPDRGNSFWITNSGGHWFLATWLPVGYRLPSSVDIVDLCIECVHHGREAMYGVPDAVVRKYALGQLTASELDKLLDSLGD